jgi:parallel beta-helix repeat protein
MQALAEADLYSFDDPPPSYDDDCDVILNAGDDPAGDSAMLNEAVEDATSWDVICLARGEYTMNRAVTVSAAANITVKGIGDDPEDVVLDYTTQTDEKGFFVTTPGFWIENMWIRNTKGNGVEVKATNSAENPNVFRKLRVDWEGVASMDNGAYSVYPTRSSWVVVEFCEVNGASDAGLYIGQVVHGIVRHNSVHGNVAGLEVENSDQVVVYENQVYDNAGGILALQEPGLARLANTNVLIRDNFVIGNNHDNFAVPGSTVANIPSGTGLMSFSGNGIEFRNNLVAENDTAGLLIVSNIVLEILAGGDPGRSWPPGYDPLPLNIFVNDNYFYENGGAPDTLVLELIQGLDNTATVPLESVIFDGGLPDPGERNICIGTVAPPSFRTILQYSASNACTLDEVAFAPFGSVE